MGINIEFSSKVLEHLWVKENDISNESNLIAFNRFEGKWIFKILILNIESNKWYISNKSFNALLLLKFLNQKIYFKETFFDLPRFEIIELEFNESNFTEIENNKLNKGINTDENGFRNGTFRIDNLT